MSKFAFPYHSFIFGHDLVSIAKFVDMKCVLNHADGCFTAIGRITRG